MMRAELQEIMSKVTIDILEKLAFMFAFPYEGEPRDSMVAGSISFTGPFSGTLIMTISTESLKDLAANMLGLDDGEETTENQRSEALKETMNVICGNLLPAIAGDEVIFDIGVPGVLPVGQEMKRGAGISDALEPSAKVNLNLDEGQCVLFLYLDGEIPKDVVSP